MSASDKVINLVKVFSATRARARDELGERVSSWMGAHPQADVVDVVVLLSSDEAFHCYSMVLLCRDRS